MLVDVANVALIAIWAFEVVATRSAPAKVIAAAGLTVAPGPTGHRRRLEHCPT